MSEVNFEQKGIVFNIQKFSVNDGPGIRTVVFFKGCQLRCKWCSNPESQLPKVQPFWDRQKCDDCRHCLAICLQHAISVEINHIHIHPSLCNACGLCVAECPQKALELQGQEMTVAEVMEVVMQDKVFYEESGGGITLSGGEMLMQPDFALELLKAAHEMGLHTCCETTGYAAAERFEKVMEHVDYILFDLKHWDAKKHQQGTGVSNELPIKNMKATFAKGKTVLPRIPVIPGFNDSLDDAAQLAKLLKAIGVERCQFLPFHQFGENKYDLLDQEYDYHDTPSLHREDLEDYLHVMIGEGIEAFL